MRLSKAHANNNISGVELNGRQVGADGIRRITPVGFVAESKLPDVVVAPALNLRTTKIKLKKTDGKKWELMVDVWIKFFFIFYEKESNTKNRQVRKTLPLDYRSIWGSRAFELYQQKKSAVPLFCGAQGGSSVRYEKKASWF